MTASRVRFDSTALEIDESGDSKRELSSLRRGLRVLRVLNSCGSVSAMEMAVELKVPRTTARRILDTLVAEGVAQKVPYDSLYRLAPSAAQLAKGVSDAIVTSNVASPILYEVTKEIGWALSVVNIDGTDAVVQVASHPASPYALTHLRVGHRIPVPQSHPGMTLLAFLPDGERATLLADCRAARPETVEDSLIIESPELIRSQGYSNPGTHRDRESLLCVPMFGAGRARAVLCMQYIRSAISSGAIDTVHVPRLRALSAEISARVQAVFDQNRLVPLPRYL